MKLTIGTVQFGLNYGINNKSGIVNQNEVKKILDFAFENNIKSLDTAQSYGNSEKIIGLYGANRFKIISKLKSGIQIEDVENSIIKSCKNLKCLSIDGVLFHDFNDFIKIQNYLKSLIT